MNPDDVIDVAAVEPVRGDADGPAESAAAVNDGFVPQMDPSDSAELNAIKDRLLKMGRTTVAAAWESGRLLSLAKSKLRGHYTQWVRMECAIDPRTAFSYVRLYRQFQADRIRLVASNISISVAMYLGGAPYAVKDRILQAASVNGIRVTHAYIDAEIRKQMAFERARDGDPEEKTGPTPKEREISFRAALKRHIKGAAIVAFRQAMEEAADEISAAVTYDERLTPADISKRIPEVIGKMLAKEIPGDSPDQTLTLAERLSRAVAARVEEVCASIQAEPNSVPATPREQQEAIAAAFDRTPTVIEICAGGGGIARGFKLAGFEHLALVERDHDACETLRDNLFHPNDEEGRKKVIEADLADLTWEDFREKVDVIAGGPPCQPFSTAGAKRGHADERNLFNNVLNMIRVVEPKAVMLENVTGFLNKHNAEYRFYILRRLEEMGYEAQIVRVNMAQFGLPQNRNRILFLGLKPNIAARFRWPYLNEIETPPLLDLLKDHVLATRHAHAANWVAKHQREFETDEVLQAIADTLSPTVLAGHEYNMGGMNVPGTRNAWRKLGFYSNRVYSLEEVLSGQHVIPVKEGGKDRDKKDIEADKKLIPLTVDMLAALQGFPPDWKFAGGIASRRMQIGNAFPSVAAQWIALSLKAAIKGTFVEDPWVVLQDRPSAFIPTGESSHPLIPGLRPHAPNPEFEPYKTPLELRTNLQPQEIAKFEYVPDFRQVGAA